MTRHGLAERTGARELIAAVAEGEPVAIAIRALNELLQLRRLHAQDVPEPGIDERRRLEVEPVGDDLIAGVRGNPADHRDALLVALVKVDHAGNDLEVVLHALRMHLFERLAGVGFRLDAFG